MMSLALAALGACATLPSNGPTGSQVVRDETALNGLGFEIVDVDPTNIAALSIGEDDASPLASLHAAGPVDVLGPGDVLSIQIFEVGASLFGNGRAMLGGGGGSGGTGGDALPPSATSEALGDGVVVDRYGQISIPYAGTITVAGMTPRQVQNRIVAALRGKSQSPQVIVTLRRSVSSTVVLMGAIARPGRYSLSLANDHLLDLIAQAGGITLNVSTGGSTATGTGPQDMIVRFTRGAATVEQPLDTIRSNSPNDLVLLPGDRIEIIRQPRTFTVFGAIDRVAQVPFESRRLSLAEALARAGGPSDARADPRSVFVFRMPPNPVAPVAGTQPKPVIYRVNMLRAQSYFLAQRFGMRDKDVIYVANAKANQPAKLAQIIGLLFSPFVAARAVTQ